MVEVIALEEDRLVHIYGKGVGKAVTEVQIRPMLATLAIVSISLACDACLNLGERFNEYFRFIEKAVKRLREVWSSIAVDDDTELLHRCRR